MSEPIILYDIPSKSTTCKAWSPNTWKVRFALNIKGLNYRTEWVEYPDIEALYKSQGQPPAKIRKDGTGYYCLPLIHDPSTNTTMPESFDIIRYLDKTYPSTPTLLPTSTITLSAAFVEIFCRLVQDVLWDVVCVGVVSILNDPSEEYFRRTREAFEGKRLEEIPTEERWQATEKAFGMVCSWLDTVEVGNKLFMGPTENISFGDMQVAGALMWAKAALGEDSEGWRRICGWHGGRWKEIHDMFVPYMAVD